MTTIDPSSQVALALKSRIAALKERGRAKDSSPQQASPAHQGAITGTLTQRMQAIAPDDPHRRQKAVRLFLQAELVREFGDGLLNDPQFGTMLDAVQEQMAQDKTAAAAVSALGDLLLAGKSTA
ncbi:hypothetical protein WG902_22315 [Ramlibacter sp. PS3R-8]|uniref:hypothetical protein n=1 Tax=Ramlibacter sp. PS3R-8 TaxID=3133437 RepID=UPI0030970194